MTGVQTCALPICDKESVITSKNEKLNDLVFASDLFKKVKNVELSEEE